MRNSDLYTIRMDQAIYGNYVKSDRLDSIVYNAFSNTSIASATELNVFIDVYSAIHSLFSEHYRIEFVNYSDITSCLINMCAHYRAFFRSLKVNTTFFLIYSGNCCDINRKFVSGYNENFYVKSKIPESKKLVEDNFKLLTALCPYLPDIHFIRSTENFEAGVIMAHLIEYLNDGKPNMIISRDAYPVQLTYLYPNTTFLYPRKKRDYGDVSILIPIFEKPTYRAEFWDFICDCRSIQGEELRTISPLNYSLFCAMTRFYDRGIKGLYNARDAVKLIKNMVDEEDIKIDVSQLSKNEFAVSNYNIQSIESRYNAIDIPFMLPYYRNSPECSSISIVNLKNDAVINQINAKYFEKNPINLMKL